MFAENNFTTGENVNSKFISVYHTQYDRKLHTLCKTKCWLIIAQCSLEASLPAIALVELFDPPAAIALERIQP